MVISALRKEEESFSSFGHLISSIKIYLPFCNCVSFSHTRRSGNSIAHFLAKHARLIDSFSVWMEDIPPTTALYKTKMGAPRRELVETNRFLYL